MTLTEEQIAAGLTEADVRRIVREELASIAQEASRVMGRGYVTEEEETARLALDTLSYCAGISLQEQTHDRS